MRHDDTELRKFGRRALIAKCPRRRVTRAYEKGDTQSFIKIIVHAETKQILGAPILGVGSDEVIDVLLRRNVCEGAAYGHPARTAHSSDDHGISADHPRQTGPVYLEGKNTTTLKTEKKT